MRALVALAVLVACHHAPATIASCADSLGALWHAPSGDWMLIDRGNRLEGYPQFDDTRPETSDAMAATKPLETAPRSLDLVRDGDDVRGVLHRRFSRGADSCVSSVPLRLTACHDETLEVILSDLAPAIDFSPCAYSTRANPSRRETWHRAR